MTRSPAPTHTLVLGANLQTLAALRTVGAPVVVAGSGRFPRLAEMPELRQWQLPVDDHTSAECVLMGLSRLPAAVRIGSVYTQDEYALVTAAAVACALGVPGPDWAVACRFRDKTLQKATLRAAGIPVAAWCELEGELDEMVARCDALGYPVVVKPVAGAGSVDTDLAPTRAAAREILSRVRESRPGHRMMAERFVEGRERTIDGLVYDGRMVFYGVERYWRPLLSMREGRGVGAVVEDPLRSPGLYERAGMFGARVLRTLGLRHGSYHMEVFEGPDGFTFGECAARLGGMFLPNAYRHKFGIDLPAEAFRLHLAGNDGYSPPPVSLRAEAAGWSSLACPPGGVLAAVPSVAEMTALPGVVECDIYAKAGRRAPDMRLSSAERNGQLLVEGADEDTVIARMDHAGRHFTEHCQVA